MLDKLVKIGFLIIMMAAVTGIASASCPSNTNRLTTTIVDVKETINGDSIKYSLETTDQSPSEGVPGVIELCIYPDPEFNGDEEYLTVLYPDWKGVLGPGNNGPFEHIGFVRKQGNSDNVPLDGNVADVGIVDYSEDGLPKDRILLLHINDQTECERNNGQDKERDNTCWRKPGKQTTIPEFPTIALPIAAVIGLMLFFKLRKR